MNHDVLDRVGETEVARRKPVRIKVCTSFGCLSSGSGEVCRRLSEAASNPDLRDRIQVEAVGCLRLCSEGPLVRVDPAETLFERVAPDQADSIVTEAAGGPASDAQRGDPHGPFFAKQASIVLENCGVIEPERIESAIARGAYRSLNRVLSEIPRKDVVDTIVKSGLRGRGGAGYPTGLKWETVRKMPPGTKYVICNADEGDPGAFMDRTILEGDPHKVLEGMAIAGYAVGASQGYIYIRGEYAHAIERLGIALSQASELNLLGAGIFGSPFNFRIDLRIGAGAYVCGEETALIASIEGGRGIPRPRPPYPAQSGLWGCPTLINNVETYANIPVIMREGADWFAAIGTAKSKGTKVFSLSGRVRRSGLVEVPMGTPLRVIVEEIGGGAPDGGKIKAVQPGGPAGGCIPTSVLDTPVDYESLQAAGSMMGSGGLLALDDSTSMVEVAKFFMGFCRDESCGKCIPCRAGTVQLHNLLTRIGDGHGTKADLARVESLCDVVKHTSLCGLGQGAPNPVISTLRHYRHEYEALLRDGSASKPAASEE